jgi:predicted amidohydrolase
MLLGADLVLIPTAADAWARLSDGRLTERPHPEVSRTLLPARAMENTCFVATTNRCGKETLNGQAMAGCLGKRVICGPKGDLVVAAGHVPTLPLADGIPSQDGATQPLGTRHLNDLQPKLYRWS